MGEGRGVFVGGSWAGVTVGDGKRVRVGGGVSVGPKVGVGQAVWVGPTVGVLGGVLLGWGMGVSVTLSRVGIGVGVKVACGRGVAVGWSYGGGWDGTYITWPMLMVFVSMQLAWRKSAPSMPNRRLKEATVSLYCTV